MNHCPKAVLKGGVTKKMIEISTWENKYVCSKLPNKLFQLFNL